jgi:LacI family transcriptional regulator
MDLRQLSAQLGLSITTVSRALAGYPDVSARTRERVIAEADRVGYRPSRIARQMKTGRTDALGLVLPVGSNAFSDMFFAEFISAIGLAAAEHDLDLIVSATRGGQTDVASIQRLVDGGRVDGVIVPRTLWNDPRVDWLIARGVPFITHGRTARAAEHAWHDVDGEAAMREATERLISHGHRRIAYINGSEEYAFSRFRHSGFMKAMDAAGLKVRSSDVAWVRANEEMGANASHRMLDTDDRPSAILCGTDRIAYGVLETARTLGLTVGRDVSVIGYDDLIPSRLQNPPLTTMRQALREEGAALVEGLMRLIAGAPATEVQELARATLVVRASDGPPG